MPLYCRVGDTSPLYDNIISQHKCDETIFLTHEHALYLMMVAVSGRSRASHTLTISLTHGRAIRTAPYDYMLRSISRHLLPRIDVAGIALSIAAGRAPASAEKVTHTEGQTTATTSRCGRL